MTVGELLQRMTSKEITEWKAFCILENEDLETARSKEAIRKKVSRR